MLSDAPPLRVGQEELVDSVVVDVTIYNPGGPHLGAFPGPLLGAFRHTPAFLSKTWPSPRDLTVKAMLKFGGTTIYIFRLHQRIGDYVPGAHNKAG